MESNNPLLPVDLPLTATFVLNDAFAWEPMADGSLVYSTETGQIVTLNSTAEAVLSYFDEPLSLESVYDRVHADLDLDLPDFLETVRQFIKESILKPS